MTTISLRPEVKDDLAALKPESLSWTQFLRALMDTVDRDELQEHVQGLLEMEHAVAMERIRKRYEAARADRGQLMTPEEAREEMRRLRDG